MPLNSKQQEAVNYLEGPLLVLAGPGTGKTQLLAHKVEHILNTTDANPENILCLTFTEAGVIAMRERLLSMRVAGVERITISTYHGFGIQILSQYKNYAEHFDRNLDQPINPVTQYKIIRDIVQNLPANNILHASNLTDLIPDLLDTISDAKSARLTAADLHTIAEANLKVTTKLNPLLSDILQNLRPRMPLTEALGDVYTKLADAIAGFMSQDPITKNIYPEANTLGETLYDAINAAEAKNSIQPLTKWKDATFEKDAEGNYRLKNRISNAKLLALAEVMAKYEEALLATSQFDFDDMIEEAIKALATNSGFKATLQERYQYILLDEFQDTNPSQFEIVRLLTDYEKPIIMAVGDDDQAIYAFQGARASNLIDFVSTYNAKTITLTENYRSTAEILNFSHEIADQIENSFAKKQGTEKILTSVLNKEIAKNSSCFHEILTPAPNEKTGPRFLHPKSLISRHEFSAKNAEYAWIAEKVHELIEQGESQKDIAIISPKHSNIHFLLPHLKKYSDINIAYEQRENILTDQRILELATLARFIYEISIGKDPSHRLLEIMSFDFWGLNPLTVVTELQNCPKNPRSTLDRLVSQPLRPVAEFLAEAVTKSFETPLEEFINFLAAKMAQNFSEAEQFNFYENLSVLRENLKSYLNVDRPRLKDFIDFLDDYTAASATILNTSPYHDSDNSVQILSAHKSKGLEFKHVFLISVDSNAWGGGKGNNNLFVLPKNLEPIRHTGVTDDEQLRLLFVAITRAKLTLTMTNSTQNFSGKKIPRLEFLKEYAIDDNSVCSPLLPNTDVFEHTENSTTELILESLKDQWLSAYFKLPQNSLPQLQKRLENYHLTASDLTSFIDIIYAGPLTFYERKVLMTPSEPASTSIHFGNAIHATFEAITNDHLSDDDAFNFLSDTIKKLDITETDAKFLQDRGKIALEASLKNFSDILRHEHAHAEVNFYSEHLTLPINGKNIPITGKVDHINIDDKTKTIEIYDFKTGNFNYKDKWGSTPSLYKYPLQLAFYKFLLAASPTYQKYNIPRAHILYVNPNADDEVYDKVLEFTPEFETEVKNLIDKVYDHIKSLDFIDETSPLHIFPDSTKGIKDIKDFINSCLL